VEFYLSALCATCAVAAYIASALVFSAGAFVYGYAFAIGVLIGMEIPLVARMNEAYEDLRTNIASVMEKDYFGALIGGLLFAFFALPKLGLTYTPLALGAINFVVASVLLWRYRSLLARPKQMLVAFWALGIGLVVLGFAIRPIVMYGEQSRYRDRVVYQNQTAYQRIVMTKWKGYHWLYLNGNIQFSTYDEERYHEPLVHPAMKLAGSRAQVLILGGGDGLAVREVVKYADVETVTLVDLDAAMIDIARTHPAIVEANNGALSDSRVTVEIGDAGKFLEQSDKLYNVIIVDLPDPKGPDLARLYSREFYRLCKRHLAVDGVVVTQASSPLHARRAFLCIDRTMSEAGFSTIPYHTYIPSMGDWGWVLGMKTEEIAGKMLEKNMLPLNFTTPSVEFLNADAMAGMLHFWKGMFDGVDTIAVSTEVEPTVDRYYRESEWGGQ
ncbi:MAG: polyamine aminopropyltransferase, partial [Candidatus Latescibacteria bacterium]|nr:polyamine aminopropyltransferase [Candidatus Latescibacterota bacterium]